MVSTNDNGESKMKAWKAAWLNANRCYKGFRANLWRLTTILNSVFDDAEFRADNGLRDDLSAAEWIDSRLPELPIAYLELRTILEYYPDRSSWEGTKLSKLRDSIKPASRSRPAKPRGKKGDANRIARERDYYAARAKHLEQQVAEQAVKQGTQEHDERLATATRVPAPATASRATPVNPAVEYAVRLSMLLEAGVDCGDTELMESLERLYSILETVLQPAAA